MPRTYPRCLVVKSSECIIVVEEIACLSRRDWRVAKGIVRGRQPSVTVLHGRGESTGSLRPGWLVGLVQHGEVWLRESVSDRLQIHFRNILSQTFIWGAQYLVKSLGGLIEMSLQLLILCTLPCRLKLAQMLHLICCPVQYSPTSSNNFSTSDRLRTRFSISFWLFLISLFSFTSSSMRTSSSLFLLWTSSSCTLRLCSCSSAWPRSFKIWQRVKVRSKWAVTGESIIE